MKKKPLQSSGNRFFVAVEGIDGSGKSLLIENFKTFFRNFEKREVKVLKEPTGFLGQEIKANHGEEFNAELNVLLFAADRLKQYDEITRKALDDGGIVISDRSVVSSLAYQRAAGVPLGWIKTVNRHVRFPDLILLLDLSPTKSLRRIANRRETTTFEDVVNKVDFQQKVRENYLELAEKHPNSFCILRSDHYSSGDLLHIASEEVMDRMDEMLQREG